MDASTEAAQVLDLKYLSKLENDVFQAVVEAGERGLLQEEFKREQGMMKKHTSSSPRFTFLENVGKIYRRGDKRIPDGKTVPQCVYRVAPPGVETNWKRVYRGNEKAIAKRLEGSYQLDRKRWQARLARARKD